MNPEVEVFKKSELPEKYTAKSLFGWTDRKFENKYLKKLDEMERERETSSSGGRTLNGGTIIICLNSYIFILFLFLLFFFYFLNNEEACDIIDLEHSKRN